MGRAGVAGPGHAVRWRATEQAVYNCNLAETVAHLVEPSEQAHSSHGSPNWAARRRCDPATMKWLRGLIRCKVKVTSSPPEGPPRSASS